MPISTRRGGGLQRGLKVSGCILLSILLCVLVAAHFQGAPNSEIGNLAYPNIALNFDPEDRNVDPAGVWVHNIATGKTSTVGANLTYESDCDLQCGRVLGWVDDAVVEVDMESGETAVLCQGYYEGTPLLPFTLQYRPGGSDFSALTEGGELVLWEREQGGFHALGQFDWNGWSFSYSWSGDGNTLFVPDETGIAALDLDTLEQTHWLTLAISYPVPAGNGAPYYRKSFEVAKDKSCVVYRHDAEILFADISKDGTVGEPIVLDPDVGPQCGFAISPDGRSVAFSVTRDKNTLFVAPYYQVWLYDHGDLVNILNSQGAVNGDVRVFW